jgi:hypothetical protein
VKSLTMIVAAVAWISLSLQSVANAAPPKIEFNRHIRPLLSDNCFHCHGPDNLAREADLRLDGDLTEHIQKLIVPGKPDSSKFFGRLISTDKHKHMPPADSGKSLTNEEIELFREWIKQGAEWSQHWAYVLPVKSEAPTNPAWAKTWSENWIDSYIASRLEQATLRPSADANKTTLLRRLSFDFTGLPPTSQEVQAFLNDRAKDAVKKQIDRLLQSPAFGERMAVYWLDLVRFADTVGYHGDQDHAISPYRDYVIDAFNLNTRFDQFTREQLAGDLLDKPTTEQRIATGYNRLLQTSHEGGVQQKEYLAMYAADRVRNFSAVWMGATMGCCECHDHKYDPYSAKDFYSLVAFFADIDEAQHFSRGGNSLPTARPPELQVQTRLDIERIKQLEQMIKGHDIFMQISDVTAEQGEILDAKRKRMVAELASLKKNKRRTMVTVAIKPRTIRLLARGDWLDDRGKIMSPAIPEFLGKVKARAKRPDRLDLANWLSDSKHGAGLLTARVMVNRFWFLLFGKGLARDLDDFGGQGEPPSHPELLDRLAHEFVDSGWNVKHMMKLIAMSHTYRQTSVVSEQTLEADLENRLLSRQNSYRLPAESIRDSALAVSRLLTNRIGGPSVKPYQPSGYYRHLNFPTRKYSADSNPDSQWRRGLYVHWQRQFLHPMLRAFDAPRREECTAQRAQSNTPLAALTLMNDPTFLEAARSFAVRVMQHQIAEPASEKQDVKRIIFAFQEVMSRKPLDSEVKIVKTLLESSRASFKANPKSATEFLAIGISKKPFGIDTIELASWTAMSRALLNAGEANYRE